MILVVDDHPANIQAIEVALGPFEARIATARSGEEALRYLLTTRVDLILLDVQMPTLDGFQVARLIRQRERTRETPIIFVTAVSQSHQDVLTGYGLGAVDFLFKPIVPEVLRAKVGVLLTLQDRTREVMRQQALLREHEKREHELTLEQERRSWEQRAMLREMQEQQTHAKEMARTIAALERAEAELKASNQRKDEFLAMLAHELRNPLAPLVAGVELLEEELAPGEAEAGEALQVMKRQLRHMTRLVDDLLDVARINSGRITLELGRVNLRDVVEQAIAASLPLFEKSGIGVVRRVAERPLWVRGDAVRLTQVVTNLLNNAVRYSQRGSEVLVELREADGRAQVTVRDQGVGLAAEMLEHVFDMFVQAHPNQQGLGVGLSLVKHLVEMHGGEVSADSTGLGAGATFNIVLPTIEASDERPAESQPAPRLEPMSVVLVEDSADIRSMITKLLVRRGHRVESAADGKSGVELILKLRPDVAVIDFGLPELDGCGVAREVREKLAGAPMRLVAMTGYGQDDDKQRALAAGFDEHLVKPVEPKQLLSALLPRPAL